ncbi:hypothetical protein C8R43DRAFT_1135391 [Mycena crocata]|nr:hypothetical protein C8R43DRAFT_1135391 [Mycena crocata]
MHSPAVIRLREAAEDTLSKIDPANLEDFVVAWFQDAERDIGPYWRDKELVSKFSSGRPHFALALLVALREVLPDSYRTRPVLYGVLYGVVDRIGTLVGTLLTTKREDFTDGDLFYLAVGSIYKSRGQPNLQKWANALLSGVVASVKRLGTFLGERQAVLDSREERNSRPTVKYPANERNTGASVNELASSLAGIGIKASLAYTQSDVLPVENNYTATPACMRFIFFLPRVLTIGLAARNASGAKRKMSPSGEHLTPQAKRTKQSGPVEGPSSTPKASGKRQSRAQEAFIQRQIKREKKAREMTRAQRRIAPQTSSKASESCEKPRQPQIQKRPALEAPLPKVRGAYPKTLATEVQTQVDTFILVPSKHYKIKVPHILPWIWETLPVGDSAKCEGFLTVGRLIFEAAATELVYARAFSQPLLFDVNPSFLGPLTDELVLSIFASDRTLKAVLTKAGALKELDPPAIFAAKAFKVYLGALFITGTLTFEGISSWLWDIFDPVARRLKQKDGVASYHDNRTALVRAGMRVGKQ